MCKNSIQHCRNGTQGFNVLLKGINQVRDGILFGIGQDTFNSQTLGSDSQSKMILSLGIFDNV